jgi:sugar lactone lactonase YvrE
VTSGTTARCLGGVLLAAIAYLCLWPVPIDPVPWAAPESPGRVGGFARNDRLAQAERIPLGTGYGPETVAFGPDGRLHAALRDGRIVRLTVPAARAGAPGGMAFDRRGHLIVADASRGLLDVSPSGVITSLVEEVGGRRLLFPDAVAIGSDGVIWFTDGSQRFAEHHDAYEFLEGRGTGRLLSYDPATREVRVRLAGLRFANGLAFGPDEAYLLVNETTGYRTRRYWLAGPRAGETEIFAANYPALPDNLHFDGERFWIGLVYRREPALDWLRAQRAFWKKLALRIPFADALAAPADDGFLIALDLDGRVVANLQDTTGRVVAVTGAVPRDGWLYLESLRMAAVPRVPVP